MPTVFNDADDVPTVDDGEGHDNKTPWAIKFLEAFFSKFPAVTCVLKYLHCDVCLLCSCVVLVRAVHHCDHIIVMLHCVVWLQRDV